MAKRRRSPLSPPSSSLPTDGHRSPRPTGTLRASPKASRRQDWARLSPQEVLARYRVGRTPRLKVLEVLLTLFNALHTSLEKTVSHKTRVELAQSCGASSGI